jgi:hypothetical protein
MDEAGPSSRLSDKQLCDPKEKLTAGQAVLCRGSISSKSPDGRGGWFNTGVMMESFLFPPCHSATDGGLGEMAKSVHKSKEMSHFINVWPTSSFFIYLPVRFKETTTYVSITKSEAWGEGEYWITSLFSLKQGLTMLPRLALNSQMQVILLP